MLKYLSMYGSRFEFTCGNIHKRASEYLGREDISMAKEYHKEQEMPMANVGLSLEELQGQH